MPVRPQILLRLTLLFLLSLMSFETSNAQSFLPGQKAAVSEPDPESIESPRFMMRRFLDIIDQGDIDTAFPYLEFPRGWGLDRRRQVIEQLVDVLNKRGDIDLALVSNAPLGQQNDSLHSDIEVIGKVRLGRETIPVELRLGGDKKHRSWRFSSEFVEKIPELSEQIAKSTLETSLPASLVTQKFLNIKLWQWIGFALSILISFVFAYTLSGLVLLLLRQLTKRFQSPIPPAVLKRILAPLRIFGGLLAFGFAVVFLDTSLAFRQKLAYFEAIALTLTFCFFALRFTAVMIDMSRLSYERQGKSSATAMLGPIQKGMSILIVVLGAISLMRSLGWDVTAIIAGLGIGGVAIALAGQKTIENLFGGVSIIMDQPVRVGDFGRFGTILGTVEDIGLRSTKVRTLDRTLVAIPNAEFSHMTLENFEKRDKFRWTTILQIRMETTTDQMRLLLTEIKELLLSHPMVYKDPARVRFNAFGQSSLNVEIFAYIKASDYNEFLAVLEDLNLRVLDIIRSVGTDLAYPAQRVVLERGRQVDSEHKEHVERRIAAIKDADGFPQPFYPNSWAEMRTDTLEFPTRD